MAHTKAAATAKSSSQLVVDGGDLVPIDAKTDGGKGGGEGSGAASYDALDPPPWLTPPLLGFMRYPAFLLVTK